MFSQSNETYVFWTVVLLGVGAALSLLVGVAELTRARKLPFFLLRRQALERGWRTLLIGIFFLILGLAVLIGGKPLLETVVPPTLTPTISPTPTLTPTETLTPTVTLTPAPTLPPTETLTPSPTLPPTETSTPGYPANLITNIPEATVTPNPEAVIGIITVAIDQTENGQPIGAAAEFDAATLIKLVALYSYDKMTNGTQTSTVWYRDALPIFIDTALWQGGTGGSTVVGDECPLEKCLFLPGNYRVAIYVGDQLKQSEDFIVFGTPPTATLIPSLTPTATDTATITLTPTITDTPSATATTTQTASATQTFTATVTNTKTATLTPSATLTRTPTSTLRPVLATDYARTAIAQTATRQAGGP